MRRRRGAGGGGGGGGWRQRVTEWYARGGVSAGKGLQRSGGVDSDSSEKWERGWVVCLSRGKGERGTQGRWPREEERRAGVHLGVRQIRSLNVDRQQMASSDRTVLPRSEVSAASR